MSYTLFFSSSVFSTSVWTGVQLHPANLKALEPFSIGSPHRLFSAHSLHPPPFPPSSLPLLLMKGLSLLPHFQKEELDMTLIFRGGLVGKRGVPFLREGGGSCNFYKKKKLKSETSNDRKKFINKNVFLCHNKEFK